MRRTGRGVGLALAVVLCVTPHVGWGEESGTRGTPEEGAQSPARLFTSGRQSLGFMVGYGFALPVRETKGELEDIQYIYAAPQWGIGVGDPIGGEAWYRGQFQLLVEGTFLVNFEPRSGFGAGLTPLIRYNFLPNGRFIPFVELGAGIMYLDMDLEAAGRSDGLNFTPQGGVGAHYFLSERTAVTAEWRFYHISNADIELPNLGINSSLFLVGISMFLQ